LTVTPNTAAAKNIRLWIEALRKNADQNAMRIRDVIAVDLPVFMSEAEAIARAREQIPALA
jgi:hypothetical protein